jgi:hypothetical protein
MRNILIETSAALPWFKIDGGPLESRRAMAPSAVGNSGYKVKIPVKKAIFDFGIADSGLNILNPHKRGS